MEAGGGAVSELPLAVLRSLQADEVLQAAGDSGQVASLERGLPEFYLLQEEYRDGHTASISLAEGTGDLQLVAARGTTESEWWLLRRDRSGVGLSLKRANEGWNKVEVDAETERHRRLYLRFFESQQQVRYFWGDSVFASGFQVGDPAPRIEATLLGGGPWRLSELRGETVVLNSWATWCLPCLKEVPELNKIVRECESEPVRFVAIARNSEEEVLDYLERREFLYRQTVETASAAEVLGRRLPRHVVVDPDGTVVHSAAGFSAESLERLRAALRCESDVS